MKNKPLLFLDTNIFIYFFQQEKILGEKAKKIFELLVDDKAKGVTSIITQIELLSIKASPQSLEHLFSLFLETPNLTVENITPEIAIESARIRREYGFRVPDAIQLATAVLAKADTFITNDKRLSQFKEIKVKLL